MVGTYDLYLRDAEVRAALVPSLVVRVGSNPTSAPLQEYLLHHNGVEHVVVDGGGRWKDHRDATTLYVRADAADTLLRVAAKVREPASDDGWRARWQRAEGAAREAVADTAGGDLHEGDVLAAVAAAVPGGGTIFVSSSMPVRDLDAFGAPRAAPLTVLANRGASGIDGIVSSAFGVASTCDAAVTCVLGDVALFHDQNGLLWAREEDAHVVFVLIDNDGGGIFHMLPVRDHDPYFTQYFATPHGLDLRHTAALHGLLMEEVEVADIDTALTRALDAGGTRILRVRTERVANQRRHAEVAAAVAHKVRDVLADCNA